MKNSIIRKRVDDVLPFKDYFYLRYWYDGVNDNSTIISELTSKGAIAPLNLNHKHNSGTILVDYFGVCYTVPTNYANSWYPSYSLGFVECSIDRTVADVNQNIFSRKCLHIKRIGPIADQIGFYTFESIMLGDHTINVILNGVDGMHPLKQFFGVLKILET